MQRDVIIHHLMAFCGGLMGVYSIAGRMGVFAAAETANMIEIVCDIVGKDNLQFAYRVGALLIYSLAMVIHTVMSRMTRLDLRIISLALDALAALALSLIPIDIDPFVALYPLFFASAYQWCSFNGAEGYTCSTIFSTNNLRQAVTAATDWLILPKEDERSHKSGEKAVFFGGTLLAFNGGVAIGYIAYSIIGNVSVLLSLIPILVVLGLISPVKKHLPERA